MQESLVSLETVVEWAQRLTPLQKIQLIERLTPDVEAALQSASPVRRRSLRGVLAGTSASDEDIQEARGDTWGSYPRENS